MDQKGCLGLVRELTEQVIAAALPEDLPDFAGDFADFALTAGSLQVSEKPDFLKDRDQGLDTTLVAGMFFQVLVEASGLPAGTRERVSFVRRKAKDFLVNRLAGQITLSQFYRLLNLIEEKAGHYFERLEKDWTTPRPVLEISLPEPRLEPVKAEELRQALTRVPLPLKGRRKLTPETIWEFLRDTEGRWFRLLDFEASFKVNKKTAWTYLNLLHHEGILEHNREKANRVRYILADPFRTAPPH
jgi:hypothetical protein